MMRKINKQVNRRPIMKAIIRRMNSLSTHSFSLDPHNNSHLADNRLACHDNAISASISCDSRDRVMDTAISIPELQSDTGQTESRWDDRVTQDAISHPFQ